MSDLNGYQRAADRTAVYPGRGTMAGLAYIALGLNGESGEVAEGVKKALRDDNGRLTSARREALVRELGDVLWYLAMAAAEIGVTLEEVAGANLEKLDRRSANGTLGGSGSDR